MAWLFFIHKYLIAIKTQAILLACCPEGVPTAAQFQFETREVPAPATGQVLLKTLFVSVAPYMRGRMSATKPYVAPFEVGPPIAGSTVGPVGTGRSKSKAAG